jgi:exopolyphosphatase/guanosine-5'-triphosphate,3'-diphosphate pyrophosphatase
MQKKNMKAAVIDMGTNTFHLVIAELSAAGVEVIYKINLPVQLGQGRINENIIIPEAFERGINALEGFKKEIDKQQAEVVIATATSAVRSAGNGKDFVDAARERADIAIQVLSGEEEAAFIFNGVKATGLITERSLIMDIGGGSTEFIFCDPVEGQLWKKSYNIGAARLMQAYFHSDPISTEDLANVNNRLEEELPDLIDACRKYQPTQLIGSAGAFETFAGMLSHGIDVKAVSSAEINLESYMQLSQRLISSSHAERQAMPDLIPLRVDMIVLASILTNYIIAHSGVKRLSLSTYDLKMGILYQTWEDQKFESAV